MKSFILKILILVLLLLSVWAYVLNSPVEDATSAVVPSALVPCRTGTWLGDEVVSTVQNAALHSAKIAVDRSGNAIVVWEQEYQGRMDIWSMRFEPATGWSGRHLVESMDTLNSSNPNIAVDSLGNAIVVWEYGSGGYVQIWYNRYDIEDGWGTAADTGARANVLTTRIAMSDNDTAMLVWNEDSSHNYGYDIKAKQYTKNTQNIFGIGVSVGEWGVSEYIAQNRNNEFLINPQIVADGNGDYSSIWQRMPNEDDMLPDMPDYDIWMNTYLPHRGWSGVENLQFIEGISASPKIAMSKLGDSIVGWKQQSGNQFDIWAAIINANSSRNIKQIETEANATSSDTEVAINGSKNAVAVWKQASNGHTDIWSSRYVSGSGWQMAELIENNNSGNAFDPKVVMDEKNNIIAVWKQSDGHQTDIWTNEYINGCGWGVAKALERDVSTNSNIPEIGVDELGNAMTIWIREDVNSTSIVANRYIAP